MNDRNKPIKKEQISERKQKQQKQKIITGETVFHELFENIPSAVAIYQATENGNDFIFKDYNRAAELLDRVKKEDIIGKSVVRVFPSVKKFGIFEVFQRVWYTGNPEHFPASLYKDKRIVGWRDNYVFKLHSGEIVAVYNDYTEQKEMERQLHEAHDSLRLAVQAADIGLWDWDLETNKVYFSPEWKRQIGYEGHEIHDDLDEWQKRVHPDDIQHMMDIVKKYHANPWPDYAEEFRFRHKNGSYRWILSQAALFRNEQGKAIRMMGAHLDITERKEMETALQESEAKFRAIFENAVDGILVAGMETKRFYMANKAMCQMLGYSLDELMNLGTEDIHPEEELPRAIAQFEEQAKKKVKLSRDIPVKRKDGSIFIAEMRSSPVVINRTEYLIGIFRDITDRLEAEKRELELQVLRQVDKLRGQLISNISHELRTPLTSIKGFTSTLLRTDIKWSDEDHKDFLETIDKECNHLAKLIGDLLDISRIDAGAMNLNKNICYVNEIFKSIDRRLAVLTEHHQLRIHTPSKLPRVFVDIMRIGQVITNLVENATKFSPKSSEITIEAKSGNNGVIISVADKGEGIPSELIDMLFDRFFQADSIASGYKSGTGLGLSICKGIIEAHGGEIWVESKVGEGSIFSFSLPAAVKKQ